MVCCDNNINEESHEWFECPTETKWEETEIGRILDKGNSILSILSFVTGDEEEV